MNTSIDGGPLPSESFSAQHGTPKGLKPLTIICTMGGARLTDVEDARLFALVADSGENFVLRTGNVADTPSLLLEAGFDFREKPLSLSCPLARLRGDCEVVIRYTGPTLELIVDGVIVDEEWPIGVPLTDGEDHELVIDDTLVRAVRGWDHALMDREIDELGCAGEPHRQTEENIGLHWMPAGHNTGVGDCMPFFHNGEYHLYYLFDRRGHASKWGLGAHQWAHASSSNLIEWTHHPMAVPVTEEWEASICTGSVFFDRGTYYCFYSVRDNERGPAPLQRSASPDGIRFEKEKGGMNVYLKDPYDPAPARDPCVFRDKTGLFHMLVTTQLKKPVMARRRGVLAHLSSPDLKNWRQEEPFILPGYIDQPECSDYFESGGWYYLIFSNHGVARYLKSRDPFGPWEKPEANVFDGPLSGVMKTAEFAGGRRIGAAFLRRERYGGNLILREIRQTEDGDLRTRFVSELLPRADTVVPAELLPLTDGIETRGGNSVAVGNSQGFAACEVNTAGLRNYYLRVEVEAAAGCASCGVCVRAAPGYESGMELRIEPARGKFGWRPAASCDWEEFEQQALYNVGEIGKPFSLEVIVNDDILDVCVAESRTLIARCDANAVDDGLFLFAHFGSAYFRNLELRPL